MVKVSLVALGLSVWALLSCGGGVQKDAEGFPPEEALAADSVAVNEVLQPRWGGIYGDYAVFISPQTSKMVFRYKLPEWTFADSSFVKGGGPDDLQYAFLLGSNNSDGSFWLSEPMKKSLMQFATREEKLEKIRTVASNSPLRVYFGEAIDNRMVVNTNMEDTEQSNDGAKTLLFCSVMDGDSLRKTDSLPCYTKTAVQITREGDMTYMGSKTYNDPKIKARGDRLAMWYGDTQNLLVYKISREGKITLEKTFGDTLALNNVQNVDVKNFEWEKRSPSLLAATDEYLYFQEFTYDKPLKESTRENPAKLVKSEIKVYDWDMKPVKKFSLGIPGADRVMVDQANGKFYAYDPRLDFEQVYVYSYKM